MSDLEPRRFKINLSETFQTHPNIRAGLPFFSEAERLPSSPEVCRWASAPSWALWDTRAT